jgi:hypothetical protein
MESRNEQSQDIVLFLFQLKEWLNINNNQKEYKPLEQATDMLLAFSEYGWETHETIWKIKDNHETVPAILNMALDQFMFILTHKLQQTLALQAYAPKKPSHEDTTIIAYKFLLDLSVLLTEPSPTAINSTTREALREFLFAFLHGIHIADLSKEAMKEQEKKIDALRQQIIEGLSLPSDASSSDVIAKLKSLHENQQTPSANTAYKALTRHLESALELVSLMPSLRNNPSIEKVVSQIEWIFHYKYHYFNDKTLSASLMTFYELFMRIEELKNVSSNNFLNIANSIEHVALNDIRTRLAVFEKSDKADFYKLIHQIVLIFNDGFTVPGLAPHKTELKKALLIMLSELFTVLTNDKIDLKTREELKKSITSQLIRISDLQATAQPTQPFSYDEGDETDMCYETEEDEQLKEAIRLSLLSTNITPEKKQSSFHSQNSMFKESKQEMSKEEEEEYYQNIRKTKP